MCLAALWPYVGIVAKAVVAGQAGPELLDPLFLAEYVFRLVPFSLFGLFFFERTSELTIYTITLQMLRMSK